MLFKLLILLGFALLLGRVKRGHTLVLLVSSVAVVYWLQPLMEPRSLTFWLPTVTIAVTALSWFLTAPPETRGWKQNRLATLVLTSTVFLLDLTRYLGVEKVFNLFSPRPQILAIGLGAVVLGFLVIYLTRKWERIWLVLALIAILFAFLLLRIPTLATTSYAWIAGLLGSNDSISLPIQWLGFSYIAFRLIHTVRDRQTKRLPAVKLDEYVTYVIFFPSLIAGPIDRLERFTPELRQPLPLENEDWLFVIQRVFFGLFKKFVIADTLAVIALSDGLTLYIHSTPWMWLTVYAYAFQIYFDFSGYTDIAIGMGRLLGIRLPENFRSPYQKSNIALFWTNWHITLTQWFRAYYFNPLTRSLRRTKISVWLMLMLVQLSTMVLIGLWHGITWNFALWGLWHGIGLFIHNRWSDWLRIRADITRLSPFNQKLLFFGGVLLTFHFIALGWVFFALSTPGLAWQTILVLFGHS